MEGSRCAGSAAAGKAEKAGVAVAAKVEWVIGVKELVQRNWCKGIVAKGLS
ncbi:MAG: hypothetical protein JWR21_1571 [Herminiimonas sp.]|nr:hypothetical protein [Herminiimonas sp.]